MPGICGIIGQSNLQGTEATVCEMVNAMTRQPDSGEGVHGEPGVHVTAGWCSSSGAFAGCQPGWNKTKSICLLFAGEVFGDLNGSDSFDGETISTRLICNYEKNGLSAVERLNGWFTGLLLDLREKKAILFNDRYGLGRLYIHEKADRVYFASEAKSLLKALPDLRRIDPAALGEWFSCGCVLQNRTLFQGISLLPGGSAWVFSPDGAVSKRKYFDPASWDSQPRLSEVDYYEQLKVTFPRILKRYLGGSLPIGMSLTGGLDGRMIMAWSHKAPGELPCYTFNGPVRDCADVKIARRVAKSCGQPHRTIQVGDEFLAAFPGLAEATISISDGAMDVTGAAELYVNRMAREFAPVRLTGNYGSEILRNNVAFRPRSFGASLFDPGMKRHLEIAATTYAHEATGNPRSFIAFKQVPWHHYARFSVEQSQVSTRSPFLDNDLVALAFQAPPGNETDPGLSVRLVAEGNPVLGRIPTDRGLSYPPGTSRNRIRRSLEEFLIKAEYAYDYGMPQWLARIDRVLKPFRLERLFLGRQKFCHFRIWYRDALAPYVKEILLDSRTLARPWLNARAVEAMVKGHVSGSRNFTTAIHQLLSSELMHRQLIEQR